MCPQCRRDVDITGNNVDSLPTVFFINELIDIYNAMKQATDNVEIACQSCSDGKAAAFCQSCNDKGLFICTKCESAHKQMKIFADHEVTSLSDLKQGSLIHLPGSKKIQAYSCSKHGGESKKLYCFTCSELICRDCTLLDHPKDKGHRYDFVNLVATTFKDELRAKILPIQDIHMAIAQAVSRLETTKSAITEQGERVKQTIAEEFCALQAILEEHKKLLLSQAGEAVERKVNMIERQQNNLKTAQADCETVLGFIRLTSGSACDEEIVMMKESIDTRVRELANKTKHIEQTPSETANMVIGTPSIFRVETLVKKQGFIAFLDAAGSDGPLPATTGKTSVFKFSLVDSRGQPSFGDLTVNAEFKSLSGHCLREPTINSKVPAVYDVSYTPSKRGRHQLTINVNGSEVATYQVYVSHPPTSLGTPIRIMLSEAAWRIALAENGDVYVTQYGLECYAHLSHDGSIKRVVKCSDIVAARGIEVDSNTGNVYISGNHKLQQYGPQGNLIKELGSIDPRAEPGEFYEPNDIRVHKNRVYICDSGNGRVQVFDMELNYIHSFGTYGREVGQFRWPEDIDFDTDGNAYIVDSRQRCILIFSPTFKFLKCIGKDSSLLGMFPLAIRILGEHMYISNPYKGVSIYQKSTGKLIHSLTTTTVDRDGPTQFLAVGLAIDMDGYVYVCRKRSNCVLVY